MASQCPQCGREIAGLAREVTFELPDEVFALKEEERTRRAVQLGKSFLLLDGERCFLRVVMPVTLDVGHEVHFGVWIETTQADFKRIWSLWDDQSYLHATVDGYLRNAVPPWGTAVLGVPCRAVARNMSDTLYIDGSSDATLARVLTAPWSTHEYEQVVSRFWPD